MLDQALAYLRHGWPIFPVCTPVPEKPGWCLQHGDHTVANQKRAAQQKPELAKPGKHPLVSWAWLQKELPDEEIVTRWWKKWPDANIGLATGALSGVVVLDSDSMDALTTVLSNGGVEPTLQVITGRPNGVHWYLQHPGRRVHNFAGPSGHAGLDFRGDGGYAVLPPSLHETGSRYRWHQPYDSTALSAVPEWLSVLLDGREETAKEAPPPLDLSDFLTGIDDGSRDDALWRLASKMRADDLPQAYAEFMISQAAALCHPPFSPAEAVSKVRRAFEQFRPTARLRVGEREPLSSQVDEAPASEERWTFEVLTAPDFLALDLPPLQFLVEGYIVDQSVSILYGGTGSLKTVVSTNLALALTTGGAWLEQFSTERTRTLVVQEDTPKAIYQQTYLQPAVDALGIKPSNLDGWLYIAASTGLLIDQEERRAELETWIQVYEPGYLILDAFYLLHRQDAKDEVALVPILQWIRGLRDRYHLGIMVIDHARKPPLGKSEGDTADDLYGGQAKGSITDAMFQLMRVKGVDTDAMLYARKLRGARPPEPARLHRDEGRVIVIAKEAIPLDGNTRLIYDWLLRQGGTRTYHQIADGVNLSPKTVQRSVRELHTSRRVSLIRIGREMGVLAYSEAFSAEEADDGWPR